MVYLVIIVAEVCGGCAMGLCGPSAHFSRSSEWKGRGLNKPKNKSVCLALELADPGSFCQVIAVGPGIVLANGWALRGLGYLAQFCMVLFCT